MATAERVREIILMFAPIVVGILLIIGGVLDGAVGLVAFGAGLLGVPGLGEALKGVQGHDPQRREEPRA